jgi:hypothetical protein
MGGYIVNLWDFHSYRLIGKLTAFFQLQELIFLCRVTNTYSPITFANISSINLVFVFGCSSLSIHNKQQFLGSILRNSRKGEEDTKVCLFGYLCDQTWRMGVNLSGKKCVRITTWVYLWILLVSLYCFPFTWVISITNCYKLRGTLPRKVKGKISTEGQELMGEWMNLTSVRSQDQRRMLGANSHTFPTNVWIHKITKSKESDRCDLCRVFWIAGGRFRTEKEIPEQTLGHIQHTCESLSATHIDAHHQCWWLIHGELVNPSGFRMEVFVRLRREMAPGTWHEPVRWISPSLQ